MEQQFVWRGTRMRPVFLRYRDQSIAIQVLAENTESDSGANSLCNSPLGLVSTFLNLGRQLGDRNLLVAIQDLDAASALVKARIIQAEWRRSIAISTGVCRVYELTNEAQYLAASSNEPIDV